MTIAKTIESITDTLFEAEDRRILKCIDQIVDRHREVSGKAEMGFMYNGVYYRHTKATQIGRLPMLDFSLNDSMEAFLKDYRKVGLDRQQISQLLFNVMMAGSDQEVRNRMPDLLVPFCSDVAKLQRTLPVEEAFPREPRVLRQLKKLEPTIAVYAMARMIY